MKEVAIFILTLLTIQSYGQSKYDYIQFDKLTEVKGTDFVIATIDNRSKIEFKNTYLLFIDTKNGQTVQIDFPKDAYIDKIDQIKIDSLGINQIIVLARTLNLDGNKTIDWNDPLQLFLISVDGKEKTQLTDNNFFVRTWTYNNQAGAIVIAGHYDINKNGKYDLTDKNEILLFDLKTHKLISKI